MLQKEQLQLKARLNLFLILSLCFAGYAGCRMPSFWSVNYYLPSFFEGFYRRGLMGTLLYPLGELRFNYYVISTIQITVFILLLGAVLYYAFSRANFSRKIIFILFFLSPAGGYLFHLIGYTDHLLYLLLFVALFCRARWVGLILMVASLFIHEEALLTTVPIYLTYLLIQRVSMKWLLFNAVVIGFAFLIITLFLQTVSPSHIEQFMQHVVHAFGPFARTEYYLTFNNCYTTQALTNTFVDLQGKIARPPQGYYGFLYFEIVVVALFSLLIAKQFIHKENGLWRNMLYFVAVWGACLSPLLLVFFGIDAYRWVFLSYASSVILFCFIRPSLSSAPLLSMTFVFMLFVAYGQFWYFDGYVQKSLELPSLKHFFH